MKLILSCILALLSTTAVFAQSVMLHITDEYGIPVPYAGVYDASQKIFLSSDSSGNVLLPGGKSLALSVNHVSFQAKEISVVPPEEDTVVNILLTYKSQMIGEVVIAAPKKIKMAGKLYPAGNAGEKVRFYHHFLRDGNDKIGSVVVLDRHPPGSRYLRRICFELDKGKKLRGENFVMEIKVFPIVHDMIMPDPVNQKPIYVRSEDLKNKNEVVVTEDIRLDYNKILISFELPNLPGNKKAKFIFVGNVDHDTPSQYGESNLSASWSRDLLKKRQNSPPMSPGKYTSLNIGIKYQLAENDGQAEQ